NGFRAAMNPVRTPIVNAGQNLLRFDHPNVIRFSGGRLDVHDMNTPGAQPGHDQVTAFDVWMRRIRAKCRAARVPAKMMQFITKFWHFNLADLAAIGTRVRINVDYQKCVVKSASGRIKSCYERIFLWWPTHG